MYNCTKIAYDTLLTSIRALRTYDAWTDSVFFRGCALQGPIRTFRTVFGVSQNMP